MRLYIETINWHSHKEDNTMQNEFASTFEAAPTAPAATSTDAIKEEVKALLKKTLAEDPEFAQKVSSLSPLVEVVNTLGYTQASGLEKDHDKFAENQAKGVLNKNGTTASAVTSVPGIVGYVIKNNSKVAIPFKQEIFEQGPDGVYVGHDEEKTLAPGATVALSRADIARFAAIVEISNSFANGTLKGSFSNKKTTKEILASFYFVYNKDTGISVHDENIKVLIDKAGKDGTSVIKPEFVSLFGFYMNPKPTRKASSKKQEWVTAQVMAANYIRAKLAEEGK